MNDAPDEGLYDYYVVFYMEGVSSRFEYEVSKDTYERVREALEDEDCGNLVFQAYRPAEQIVVNSRFIQLAHFLWEPKTERDGGSARAETVDLYFVGREEPIRLEADDPEEVFDLLLAMETEAFPRCSIVDAGGEEAVIDLRKLVCAELPLGMAQARETDALVQLEDEI